MPFYVSGSEENPELTQQGIEAVPSTVGARASALYGESLPVQAGMALDRYMNPPAPSPVLQPDEANKQYGIEGQLKFTSPVQADVANDMMTAKNEEMRRKDILARTPDGITPAATNLALSMVTDPLNIAAAFIPFGGEARAASLAGRVGLDSTTLAGRSAIKFGVGAYQGAAMQVPLDAMRYGLAQANNEDFTAGDALRDIAYGAIFQGAVHSGLGALKEGYGLGKDYLSEKFNSSPQGEAVNSDFPTKDLAARASISAMAEGRPVDIDPILQEKINSQQQAQPITQPQTIGDGLAKRIDEEFGEHADAVKDVIKRALNIPNTEPVLERYLSAIEESAKAQSTHLIDTPERQALRQEIEETITKQRGFANPDSAPKGQPDQGFRADIVLGPPAAGKSSVAAEPLAMEHNARLLDNDEVKKMMPEYDNGNGASRVHVESDTINSHILRKSIAAGENIVLPKIGRSQADMEKLLDELDKAGYKTHLTLVEAPPEITIPRAMARYAKKNRAIPAHYLRAIGDSPIKTYEALKERAHGYTRISTAGQGSRIIEKVRGRGESPGEGAGLKAAVLRPGGVGESVPAGGNKAGSAGSSKSVIKIPGKADVAVTPAGREIGVHYGIAEAKDLVASQLDDLRANPKYPKVMQPRDRSRFASSQQIAKIANNLNPRLLMENPLSSEGAPIIGADGVVESGNGRVLAIRKAYNDALPGGDRYRQALEAAGYDTKGMDNPVLVRQRDMPMTDEQRVRFAQESNQRTTASMSSTEQAQTDSSHLSEGTLEQFKGGDLKAAGNRDFLRNAVKEMIPENEHASAFTKDGELSQEAERRIQGALLSKAYGDESILRLLTENTDNELTSLGKALTTVSPLWAKMRDGVANGRISPGLDITADLVDAVKLILRARRDGRPVKDFLSTKDMFGAEASPTTQKLLGLFHLNDKMTKFRAVDKITADLSYYAREAEKATPGKNLFGEAPSKPSDIIDRIYKKAFNEQSAAQENLFQPRVRTPVEDAGESGGSVGQPGGESTPSGNGEPRPGSDNSIRAGNLKDVRDYVLGKPDPRVQEVMDAAEQATGRARADTGDAKAMSDIQQEITDMESAIKNAQAEGRLEEDQPELQDANDMVKAAEARAGLYESLAQCMETEAA